MRISKDLIVDLVTDLTFLDDESKLRVISQLTENVPYDEKAKTLLRFISPLWEDTNKLKIAIKSILQTHDFCKRAIIYLISTGSCSKQVVETELTNLIF